VDDCRLARLAGIWRALSFIGLGAGRDRLPLSAAVLSAHRRALQLAKRAGLIGVR